MPHQFLKQHKAFIKLDMYYWGGSLERECCYRVAGESDCQCKHTLASRSVHDLTFLL